MFNFNLFMDGFIAGLKVIIVIICIIGPVIIGAAYDTFLVLILYVITIPVAVGIVTEDIYDN